MAAPSICSSCLRRVATTKLIKPRLLQLQLQIVNTNGRSHSIKREYSQSRRLLAEQTTATPSSSPTPPPTPPKAAKPLSASEHDAVTKFASSLRSARPLKSTTEPYIAYGGTEQLFRECAKQCDYTIPAVLKTPPEQPPLNAAGEHIGKGTGWWYESSSTSSQGGGLGLDVTFNTWAQVLMLHMWMLTARLRAFPRENVRVWHQSLLDHFFHAAEDRMVVWHGLSSRAARNRYLKDLLMQWRGVILSYDEGLIRGDAVLASAIWRNVFKAQEDVDLQQLALVTAYVRRELRMLDQLSDEQLSSGEVPFGSPRTVGKVLSKLTSSSLDQLSAQSTEVAAKAGSGVKESP